MRACFGSRNRATIATLQVFCFLCSAEVGIMRLYSDCNNRDPYLIPCWRCTISGQRPVHTQVRCQSVSNIRYDAGTTASCTGPNASQLPHNFLTSVSRMRVATGRYEIDLVALLMATMARKPRGDPKWTWRTVCARIVKTLLSHTEVSISPTNDRSSSAQRLRNEHSRETSAGGMRWQGVTDQAYGKPVKCPKTIARGLHTDLNLKSAYVQA